MSNFFYKIYTKLKRHKRTAITLLVLFFLLLAYIPTQIQFKEDITQLIPSNTETEKVQEVLQAINFTDKIIVNIKKSPKATTHELADYASHLTDSLGKSPYIKKIEGVISDINTLESIDFIYQNLPLFLEEKDYTTIQKKLHADSILKITENNYKTLISPSGLVAKSNIQKDPLGLSYIALKKLKKIGVGDQFTIKNGFLITKNEQNILLFLTPKYSSNNTEKNKILSEYLYDLKNTLDKKFNKNITAEYFGAALIAAANAKQIKHDIKFTVSIALTILLIVLVIFYRKLYIPLILITPTILGGLTAIFILFLLRDEISSISLGIGSILLGITLDYSLHILTHIKKGNSVRELYTSLTQPIVMSSLTTACAFLCLLFLDSQALQDLGLFAAISVFSSSGFALIFIPQVYKPSKRIITTNRIILGDKLVSYPLHSNKWVITGVILIFIVSCFTYQNVRFNEDLSSLNYEPPEIVKAQKDLDSITNLVSKSVYIVSFNNNKHEALAQSDTIYSRLQKLLETNKVKEVNAVNYLVNSKQVQQQKIERWKSFWNNKEIQHTKENLISAGNKFGFSAVTHQQFYNLLNKDFKTLSIEDFKKLSIIPVSDYINVTPSLTTVTSIVKTGENNIENLKNYFHSQPNTLVIDRKEMNETFLGHLKNDFGELIAYSLIAVVLLLLIFYRSISLTIVTALPIFFTWVITLGIMGVFGIEFNIFNIIISTFIFGLGVDYSIFITNAMLQELRTGGKVLPLNKTSVLLSVLTTILGIGVLIFAKHPALYSISLVSVIGILTASIVAFSLQPLLFKLFIGSAQTQPTPLRLLLHSMFSFIYFGLGSILLSTVSVILFKFIPLKEKSKMKFFHSFTAKFFTSVLYSNSFVKKKVIYAANSFKRPSIIIANHTSFLDTLTVFMTYRKLIFLVNDWVYNSPVFGRGVRAAGFYPVSEGIDNSFNHLQEKVNQGYSIVVFPEGSRSRSNKIKRFHKGAFLLAEKLNLPITPVLIHGNSEVLPKGDFVIRNGSITVKVLPEIDLNTQAIGASSRQKTKNISQVFKKEFFKFRREVEGEKYFHQFVKNEYRFKGRKIYKHIKEDLNKNSFVYYEILKHLPQKANILHLSNEMGQLDILCSLDGPDRNITTLIPQKHIENILHNTRIFKTRNNLKIINSFSTAIGVKNNYILVKNSDFTLEKIKDLFLENIKGIFIYGIEEKNKKLDIENYILQVEVDNMRYYKIKSK